MTSANLLLLALTSVVVAISGVRLLGLLRSEGGAGVRRMI